MAKMISRTSPLNEENASLERPEDRPSGGSLHVSDETRGNINATLRASGVGYQIAIGGTVDFDALGRAIGERYPKINRFLAE